MTTDRMRQYFLLAAATFAFAACTGDDAATPSGGEAALRVNAAISGTATRASGTSWTKDDQIGISTVEGTATSYTNVPYTWDGNGNFVPDDENIYFQSAETVTFRAHYPYRADATYTDVNTSAANQSAANQPKIDFLYAEGATASKANPTADFTGGNAFTHCMSQITIRFTEGRDMDFDGQLTGYTLSGLVLTGSFNTATGEAAATGTTPEPLAITLSGVTATNKVYTAAPVIVFPQEVDRGKIAIRITVGGQPYHATLTLPDADKDGGKDKALKPGYNYLFPVKVSKTELTVGDADIIDWETVTGDESTAIM
ncbi:fimbrillin family protein [Bacteroides fluxus]|uniref:fimbrillin family protein n=1 Tax=Bacteroides fluxus TaxID=626930 RepID=UPI002A823CCF|nr:fimbrillin family protein [Bacteroides fluxus]MDY3788353.1 fimbrillin family protein [Bacteroides fluxus]